MLEESVILEPHDEHGYPLHIVAKRYWHRAFETNIDDPDALTLIFLHAIMFHKETWEPTIEQLFDLASVRGGTVKIREAWAVDCPNHGESALLNENALQRPEFLHNCSSFEGFSFMNSPVPNSLAVTCEKYAQGVHQFLSAGPERGACVDFRTRNMVGIGHSLGGFGIFFF